MSSDASDSSSDSDVSSVGAGDDSEFSEDGVTGSKSRHSAGRGRAGARASQTPKAAPKSTPKRGATSSSQKTKVAAGSAGVREGASSAPAVATPRGEATEAPATSAQAKPAAAKPRSRGGKALLPDRLPVVFPASLLSRAPERHATAFVHMTGGEVDLEGDVGAIGRLTTASDGVLLDLQGQRFAGAVVPCCTHLVLALGTSEARVEAIASDAVLLQHVDSAFDSMGGALVSGHEVERLLAFEDVEQAPPPSAAGADGEVQGAAVLAGSAAKSATKRRKGGKHEFFGTRRTSTTKGKGKRRARK